MVLVGRPKNPLCPRICIFWLPTYGSCFKITCWTFETGQCHFWSIANEVSSFLPFYLLKYILHPFRRVPSMKSLITNLPREISTNTRRTRQSHNRMFSHLGG